MARPTSSGDQLDMATEEDLARRLKSPSPPPCFPTPSILMVRYYQGSGQSPLDKLLQNRQQRPTNSGDQSDTEEHFDYMNLLKYFPPSPPRPSPSLYITGDLALSRHKLLQFWMDASDKWGPRGGIMTMNKENLPQSLEYLRISLLHLYVEDEFDLLYWPGESSWEQLKVHLRYFLTKSQEGKFSWVYTCDDLERNDYGEGMFGNERVTIGMCRIGPREWVAKIRYQRHSLEYTEDVYQRTAQVVFEDARLDFPDLSQDFFHTITVASAQRKDPDEDDIDFLLRTIPVIDGCRLHYLLIVPFWFRPTANPDEDFVNGEVEPLRNGDEGTEEAEIAESQLNPDEDFVTGEVEPVRIGDEGTEEAEIAESQLNPGPSRKRQRKEKTPTGERGNKKTARVKNVIPLDKILQVKEMSLKSAAELLKGTHAYIPGLFGT